MKDLKEKEPLKDVKAAVDDEDVVNAVQKQLDETFGDVSADDLKDEEDPTSDDQTDKDDQTDDSTPKDDTTPDDKPEDKEDKEGNEDTDGDGNKDASPEPDDKSEQEVKGDGKTEKKFELPDAFHRAAEHDGWKPEDIKGFFEADPERALVTFQNIYTSMNRASKEFANIGRVKAEQTRQQVESAAKVEDKVEAKDFVDVEKLKEEYGDNPLINVVEPLNDALKQISQEVKSLKAQKSSSAQDIRFAKNDQIAATQHAEATAKQADMKLIEQFFTAEDMKSYRDFYGVIGMGQIFQDLQPGQQKNRYEVLQTADQMIVGNAMQEIELPVNDALLRAHLLVTEPIREKVIRDEIKSSLTKRNKGLTLRPSVGKRSAAAVDEGGKPKDKAGVIANAERNLAKAFDKN